MKLTEDAKKKITTGRVIEKICVDTNTPYTTFRRWIDTNSEKLTLKKVIDAISKHTGIDETELFINETETV